MTRGSTRILVNLSRLGPGCPMTHVSRFLPELVAERPDDVFVALVPDAHAEVVGRWGDNISTASPVRSRLWSRLPWDGVAPRFDRRPPDLILGPLSHVPLISRAPQIVWACGLRSRGITDDRPDPLGVTLSRVLTARTSLVVYPTAAARRDAEASGLRGPGLVLRPPVRAPQQVWPAQRDVAVNGSSTGVLQILVATEDQPEQNLALVGRLSTVLTDRQVDHRILLGGPVPSWVTSVHVSGGFDYDRENLGSLRGQVDVVLLPQLAPCRCALLAELERAGLPVAASSVGTHIELRARARLFDPASAHGAADAVLAAVAGPSQPGVDDANWRLSTSPAYAAAVSSEIDRLAGGGDLPWAV